MLQKLEFFYQILLNNCVKKRPRSSHLPYLTQLEYLHIWLWIRMSRPKIEEVGSVSKFGVQKLHRLYTQGVHTYGCVRILVKASNLSVSKVRHFIYSKPSYTKFTMASFVFKKIRGFVKLKIDIWYMDLAYVDKLAKYNNGVKCLLHGQDMSDRYADAKGRKTKDSETTVCSFLSKITKSWPKFFWNDKGTGFAERYFKKSSKAEGTQIYSTMSETKAASAERTKRSLKTTFYRYMEDCRYKYIHRMSQSVTTLNSEKSCSIDLKTKTIKISTFFVHSIQQATTRTENKVLYWRLTLSLEVWLALQQGLKATIHIV